MGYETDQDQNDKWKEPRIDEAGGIPTARSETGDIEADRVEHPELKVKTFGADERAGGLVAHHAFKKHRDAPAVVLNLLGQRRTAGQPTQRRGEQRGEHEVEQRREQHRGPDGGRG